MKVKMLEQAHVRTPSGRRDVRPGEVLEMPAEWCQRWIETGKAEAVPEPSRPGESGSTESAGDGSSVEAGSRRRGRAAESR